MPWLFNLSGLNPLVDFGDVAWGRVVQAAGIAFLFVPISTVAYLSLPAGKNNSASALINLARNLGGSFGISLGQTMARPPQPVPSNPSGQPSDALRPHLSAGDRATRAPRAGHAGRDWPRSITAVQQQATMMAYIDIYYLLGWICLLLFPLVFLLGKTKPGQAPPGH